MTLATKYRPKELNEVCEQKVTVEILKRQLENKSFKNVILFSGHTGCGKTTLARIFANKINNNIGEPIELDCASNNSVDNIRLIVESANQRAITGEYKIFILDEVHMLSNSAWNALLKCIEETPKYTIFILCTTDRNKVLPTVLNRAQCFNITPISPSSICNRLMYICQNEGFTNYEKICELISHNCKGSMRNAITSIEQIADYSKSLSIEVAKKILPGISYEHFFRLTWAINKKSEAEIFSIIDELYSSGQALKVFIDEYFNFIVDLTKFILFKNISCTNIPNYLASDGNTVVQDTINIDNNLLVFNKLADKLLEIKQTVASESDYKNIIIIMLINFIRG